MPFESRTSFACLAVSKSITSTPVNPLTSVSLGVIVFTLAKIHHLLFDKELDLK